MANPIAERRDIDFVLFEQLQIERLRCEGHSGFSEITRKTIDMMINEACSIAIREILPTRKTGDEDGCAHHNGKIKTPRTFRKAYEILKKGEWLGLTEKHRWGGHQIPETIATAVNEYFIGANNALMMYAVLTHNVGRLIEKFGTDKDRQRFLPEMYSGRWTGAMLLTEPEAGSDLGAVKTTAVKINSSEYTLFGEKTFISAGDHDLAPNIIYAVVARIQDAPPGIGGLGIFLVPKKWCGPDDRGSQDNDIICTGLEKKMGLHGNATCTLLLGSKKGCTGILLGQGVSGVQAISFLLDEARTMVGMQGLGYASSAYMHALDHAKTRFQGRHLSKALDIHSPSVPIIQHPGVRANLIWMKAHLEGIRSLMYYVAWCRDMLTTDTDTRKSSHYRGMADLLVPIAKAYVSDRAFKICHKAVQIFGGYGYIKGYAVEQLFRDCRAALIYEGTNGIQALDFLGRRLRLQMGEALAGLFVRMQATINSALESPLLRAIALKSQAAVGHLQQVTGQIKIAATSAAGWMTAFSFADSLLDAFGDVILSWMLLWRAQAALDKLSPLTDLNGVSRKAEKNRWVAFYYGQIKSAEFFNDVILPTSLGKIEAIRTMNNAAISIPEFCFGG